MRPPAYRTRARRDQRRHRPAGAAVVSTAVTVMDITDWLQAAIADAERRGLGELRPLLQSLAQATDVLRRADWNTEDPVNFRARGNAGTRRGPA